jgi:hypothetical protein
MANSNNTTTPESTPERKIKVFEGGDWVEKVITGNTIGDLRNSLSIPHDLQVRVNETTYTDNTSVLPDVRVDQTGVVIPDLVAWQSNTKTGG